MSNSAPTILVPDASQATIRASPVKLRLDDHAQPDIVLPPPMPIGRGHQRSKTSFELSSPSSRSSSTSPTRSSVFSPFRRGSRTPSPERSETESTYSSNIALDASTRVRAGTVGKLSSWFEGTSDPVNISFVPSPKKEISDPFYKVESGSKATMQSQDKFTARPPRKHTASPSTANSSVFSFFKRSIPVQAKAEPDDLLHIDIDEALFPGGPVACSEDAFRTLQTNAESLIKKIQLSYAENLGALRQISNEKSAQEDELEASQTRNEHLKLQLLVMAEKAAEQEKTIHGLTEELHKHQQGIRMIAEDEPDRTHRQFRRNRLSECSSSADSMLDSDMSSAESVFSDADSIHTRATSVAASPVMKHARLYSPKLTPNSAVTSHVTPVLVADCSNCHGVPASEAWDVIGIMKAESMGLKQRVVELENAQDSALDFLTALNL